MKNENQIPIKFRKSFQNFAVAYFFVFKVQLENAQLIETALNEERPQNSLLTEFGHGYITGAVYEFVFFLYDNIDLLRKIVSTYKYKKGGAIEQIFKFRRHILAHRAKNWGSEESKETISFFRPGQIYSKCYEAADEFSLDLRRYMSFEAIETHPSIQKIRRPDLLNLLRNSPNLEFFRPIPDELEILKFFGVSMRPKDKI